MGELLCKHSLNAKSHYWYVVPCLVLKEMPDGERLKVLVLADRYGVEKKKPNVRYVPKALVRNYKGHNESPDHA